MEKKSSLISYDGDDQSAVMSPYEKTNAKIEEYNDNLQAQVSDDKQFVAANTSNHSAVSSNQVKPAQDQLMVPILQNQKGSSLGDNTQLEIENLEDQVQSERKPSFAPIQVETSEQKINRLKDNDQDPNTLFYEEINRNLEIHLNKSNCKLEEFKCDVNFWPSEDMKHFSFFPTFYPGQIEITMLDNKLVNLPNDKLFLVTLMKRLIPFGYNNSNSNFYETQFIQILDVDDNFKALKSVILTSDFGKNLKENKVRVEGNFVYYFVRDQQFEVVKAQHYGAKQKDYPKLKQSKLSLKRLNLVDLEEQDMKREIDEGHRRYNVSFMETVLDQHCFINLWKDSKDSEIKQKVHHCIRTAKHELEKLNAYDSLIINVQARKIVKDSQEQSLKDEAHKLMIFCDKDDCECQRKFSKEVLLIKERYDQELDDRFYEVRDGGEDKVEIVQLSDINKAILTFDKTKVSGSLLMKFLDKTLKAEIRTESEILTYDFEPEKSLLKETSQTDNKQEICLIKLQSIELNKKLYHFFFDSKHQITLSHFQDSNQEEILNKLTKRLAHYPKQNSELHILTSYTLATDSNEILSSIGRLRSGSDFEKIFKDYAKGKPMLLINKGNKQIRLYNIKLNGKRTFANCYNMSFTDPQQVLRFEKDDGLSPFNKFIKKVGLTSYWKGQRTVNYKEKRMVALGQNHVYIQHESELEKIEFPDGADKQNFFLVEDNSGKLIRVNYEQGYKYQSRRQYQNYCFVMMKELESKTIHLTFSTIGELSSLEKDNIHSLKSQTLFLQKTPDDQFHLTKELKNASKIQHILHEDFDFKTQAYYAAIVEFRHLIIMRVDQNHERQIASIRLRYKGDQLAQSSETVSKGGMKYTNFVTASFNFNANQVSSKFICEYEFCEGANKEEFSLVALRFINPYPLLISKVKGIILHPNFVDNKINGVLMLYTNKYVLEINNNNMKYENEFFKFGRQKLYVKDNKNERDYFIMIECILKEQFKRSNQFTLMEKQQILDTQMSVLMQMTPFDIQNLIWIDSSILFQSMFRGLEILMGASKAHLYFNQPREAIEAFEKPQQMVQLSFDQSPMDTRVEGDQAYFDFNNSSCLEFTLKAGNKFVLNPLLRQIFAMKNFNISRDLIMSILVQILKIPDPPRVIMDFFKSGFEEVEEQKILSIEKPLESEEAPAESTNDVNAFVLQDRDLNDQNHIESVVINRLNQLKDAQDTENPTAKIIEVQHSIISFVHTIINSKMTSKDKLTELSLSELVTKLKNYPDTFLKPSVKIIIDHQFIYSSIFFKILMTIYCLGFVATFIASQMTTDSETKRVLLIICLVTQSLFFILETIQLLHYGGFRKYFKLDKWNILDQLQFFSNLIFFIISSQRGFIDERNSVEMTIFVLFIAILAFVKILYFMRLFKGLGALVQMLIMTILELNAFVVFLFVSVLFFTFAFIMIKVDFEEDEYNDLPRFIIVCIQSYRNSIGDIKTPLYSHWTELRESGDISASQYDLILWIMWLFWFINTFLNLIILLNFLIAVISQVYDQTMSQKQLNQYWDKSNFNQEFHIIMSKFIKLQDLFKVLVITQAKDLEENSDGEDSYVGFVETIKRAIHKQMQEFKDYNQKQQKSIFENFDSRFKALEQDVQSLGTLKEDITTVNQRLDSLSLQMNEIVDLIKRK